MGTRPDDLLYVDRHGGLQFISLHSGDSTEAYDNQPAAYAFVSIPIYQADDPDYTDERTLHNITNTVPMSGVESFLKAYEKNRRKRN